MNLDIDTQMATPEQCVRIVVPHEVLDTGDEALDRYHQWIATSERVRANVLGVNSPRMTEADWSKWRCNNGDCHAFAFVHDDLARLALITADERTTA